MRTRKIYNSQFARMLTMALSFAALSLHMVSEARADRAETLTTASVKECDARDVATLQERIGRVVVALARLEPDIANLARLIGRVRLNDWSERSMPLEEELRATLPALSEREADQASLLTLLDLMAEQRSIRLDLVRLDGCLFYDFKDGLRAIELVPYRLREAQGADERAVLVEIVDPFRAFDRFASAPNQAGLVEALALYRELRTRAAALRPRQPSVTPEEPRFIPIAVFPPLYAVIDGAFAELRTPSYQGESDLVAHQSAAEPEAIPAEAFLTHVPAPFFDGLIREHQSLLNQIAQRTAAAEARFKEVEGSLRELESRVRLLNRHQRDAINVALGIQVALQIQELLEFRGGRGALRRLYPTRLSEWALTHARQLARSHETGISLDDSISSAFRAELGRNGASLTEAVANALASVGTDELHALLALRVNIIETTSGALRNAYDGLRRSRELVDRSWLDSRRADRQLASAQRRLEILQVSLRRCQTVPGVLSRSGFCPTGTAP